MKRFVLLALSIVVAYCGIGSAQRCPIGCESKIDALQNQAAAQEKALNEVPYIQKFTLTPSPDAKHALSAERVLPDYVDVLLVHVSVDHKESAVVFPTAPIQPSNPPTLGRNQAILASKCRDSGGTPAPAKINVFLGLLQQEAPGRKVFGVRITVEGCNPTAGQIPVEVAVLQKI
jgi:hypothetical protein